MYYGMLKKSFFRVDLWPLKGPFCFLRLESEDILLVGRVLEDYTQLLFVGVGVIFSLSLLLLLLAPKTRYISGANDGRIFLCRVLLLAPQTYEFFFAAFHFWRHRRAGASPPVFYFLRQRRDVYLAPTTVKFFFAAFHFWRHRRAGVSPPAFYFWRQ